MKDLASISIGFGQSILIPESHIRTFRNFEPLSIKYFAESVKPGQTVIDVGANFGFYTAIASSLVEQSGKVFSFEPSPETNEILRLNTTTMTNVDIIQKAVAEASGEVSFFHTKDFVNSGTVENPPFQNDADVEELTVDAVSLDDYFTDLPEAHFLKVDIQGDDIKALKGARELIRRSGDIKVLVEWAPAWMKNAGYEILDLPDTLRDLGLTKITLLDDWRSEEMPLDQFLEEVEQDTKGSRFVNVFACK